MAASFEKLEDRGVIELDLVFEKGPAVALVAQPPAISLQEPHCIEKQGERRIMLAAGLPDEAVHVPAPGSHCRGESAGLRLSRLCHLIDRFDTGRKP